jgi:hypothetical protein
MPWTFAHPAAVLPLRSLARARLSFAALVVGSITPDLGYYVGRFDLARAAHTLAGLFVVCLPAGFVLLALLRMFRRPVCHLLPQPHRGALSSLPPIPLVESMASTAAVAASLLVGATTHVLWDSFTHATGWMVVNLPLLQMSLPVWPRVDVPLFRLLQHASTILGVAALGVAYSNWLRQASDESGARDQQSEHWRYVLLAALALVSLLCAGAIVFTESLSQAGGMSPRIVLVRLVVLGTTVFALALAAASLAVAWRARDA